MGYRSDVNESYDESSSKSLWKPERRFHLSPGPLIAALGLSFCLGFFGDMIERGLSLGVLDNIAGKGVTSRDWALFVVFLMLALTQSHLAAVQMALFPEGSVARARLRQFYFIEMWILAGVAFASLGIIRSSDIEMTFSRLCFGTVLSATAAAIIIGFRGGPSEQ